MTLESGIILIILGIAAYMFIRRHRRVWAVGVLPLMVMPLFTLIYSPVGRHIARLSGLYRAHLVRLGVYIAAIVVASVMSLLFSRRIPAGKIRNVYLTSALLFTALLAILFWMKVVD